MISNEQIERRRVIGVVYADDESVAGPVSTVLGVYGYNLARISLYIACANPQDFRDFLDRNDPSLMIYSIPSIVKDRKLVRKVRSYDPKQERPTLFLPPRPLRFMRTEEYFNVADINTVDIVENPYDVFVILRKIEDRLNSNAQLLEV